MEGEEDDALLSKAGQGDERAFNTLVLRHSSFVHTIALRFTQNAADADEITQSVFWTLWRHAARWSRERARLRTWLYRVTVNRCIDHGRGKGRWRRLFRGGSPDVEPADPAPTAEARHGAKDDLSRVQAALLTLAPRQRMALFLVAYEGLSGADAAEAMGTSPGAVEQLLARARKRLRELTEGETT
ncbi:RNA polymerase sigma factor [Aestuariibius insulae]|uniref:RNA polymerase sigma factor n=1 Tax=Aestuariibius insulae TaxID=2058287 RepID=UPI00398F0C9E